TKLRQTLINLIGNAIKFTEAGGVAVRIGKLEGQKDNPEICPLHFEIEDTGRGIIKRIPAAFLSTWTWSQ
ncbi:MAG: hypothetical protein GY757_26915, partial [bacterium]|nr:hypothetical protein [bacterium]